MSLFAAFVKGVWQLFSSDVASVHAKAPPQTPRTAAERQRRSRVLRSFLRSEPPIMPDFFSPSTPSFDHLVRRWWAPCCR